MKEAVSRWDICRRQKRPGVLSCAVREAGILPAVRARFLTKRAVRPPQGSNATIEIADYRRPGRGKFRGVSL